MQAWRSPILVDESTLGRARRPHVPELAGVLPGFGRHEPNPWGLGPEIRGNKTPHWTGLRNSPTTFGHFGQSGTMVWIDPVADTTLIALSDEPFGSWASAAWPALADAVLLL
jgi:CubicO group peptidase (beta-lactamase class C family)